LLGRYPLKGDAGLSTKRKLRRLATWKQSNFLAFYQEYRMKILAGFVLLVAAAIAFVAVLAAFFEAVPEEPDDLWEHDLAGIRFPGLLASHDAIIYGFGDPGSRGLDECP
jgi:hypothetical protein